MARERTLAETVRKAQECVRSLTGLELTTIEGVYLRHYCLKALELERLSIAEYDLINNPAIEAAHRFLRREYGFYYEDLEFLEILLDGDSVEYEGYFKKLQEEMHHP